MNSTTTTRANQGFTGRPSRVSVPFDENEPVHTRETFKLDPNKHGVVHTHTLLNSRGRSLRIQRYQCLKCDRIWDSTDERPARVKCTCYKPNKRGRKVIVEDGHGYDNWFVTKLPPNRVVCTCECGHIVKPTVTKLIAGMQCASCGRASAPIRVHTHAALKCAGQ